MVEAPSSPQIGEILMQEGSDYPFRAYLIIDSDQFERARVVGYLLVTLRMDEMVGQGKTLKLVVSALMKRESST